MALTLYKRAFTDVSVRIEADPVAVLFAILKLSRRFHYPITTAGDLRQGARPLGKTTDTRPGPSPGFIRDEV